MSFERLGGREQNPFLVLVFACRSMAQSIFQPYFSFCKGQSRTALATVMGTQQTPLCTTCQEESILHNHFFFSFLFLNREVYSKDCGCSSAGRVLVQYKKRLPSMVPHEARCSVTILKSHFLGDRQQQQEIKVILTYIVNYKRPFLKNKQDASNCL